VRVLPGRVREAGETGIGVVEEVDGLAGEALIVPDVFEVVILRDVPVEADGREVALLPAGAGEAELL
jgi:hypothetical protein